MEDPGPLSPEAKVALVRLGFYVVGAPFMVLFMFGVTGFNGATLVGTLLVTSAALLPDPKNLTPKEVQR